MDKFVVAIKHNNKILRERNGAVYLPFGSEYSILMKNLNSRKALVSISIDGKDILNGKKLIIDANSNLELERFLKNDLNNGNRFKFVEFTKEIQEHLGDNIENGFIRVSARYEKDKPKVNEINIYHHKDCYYHPVYQPYEPLWGYGQFYCSSDASNVSKSINNCAYTVSASSLDNFNNFNEPLPDEGVSVPGSISNQRFSYGSIGDLEDNEVVFIIQLKGFKPDGKSVMEPITVQHVIDCPTCGKKNGSFSRYCNNCGTRLS
jgi:hypothetical protein